MQVQVSIKKIVPISKEGACLLNTKIPFSNLFCAVISQGTYFFTATTNKKKVTNSNCQFILDTKKQQVKCILANPEEKKNLLQLKKLSFH